MEKVEEKEEGMKVNEVMVHKKDTNIPYSEDNVGSNFDKNNMSCSGDAMVYKNSLIPNAGDKIGSSFDKNNVPCSGDAKVYKKDASQNSRNYRCHVAPYCCCHGRAGGSFASRCRRRGNASCERVRHAGDKVDSNIKGLDRNSMPRSDDVTVYKKDTPLWTRKPEDVSHEEYASFYKALSKDQEDHFAVKHFSVDGLLSFHALLFVPRLFDLIEEKRNNFKTYARRVFIKDSDEYLPEWLNMIKGVVDFEESPLNISREARQRDKIEQTLITKCLEMFAEIADKKDRYQQFHDQFGNCLKFGVFWDSANRMKIAELLRYRTSKSGDEQISLNEYVDRMKEGQKVIFYITGESIIFLSPAYTFHKIGLEVLHMCEGADELALLHLTEFHGKMLVCLDDEVLDEMD